MRKLFPAVLYGRSSSQTTYVGYCWCLIVALLSGCETGQVHWDSMKMREHLDHYYSEEIIDNLIRARNGLPFVHVDIDTLTASVTGTVTGNVGGGQTLNNTGTQVFTKPAATRQVATTTGMNPGVTTTNAFGTAVGVLGTISDLAVRPFTFSVAPSRTDKADVTTKPIVNDPCAYWPYLKFLTLPKMPMADPNQPVPSEPRLRTPGEDDCTHLPELSLSKKIYSVERVAQELGEPPPDTYVPDTLQKRGKYFYYVPRAYSQAYFDLCLALMTRKAVKSPEAESIQSKLNQILNR